MVVRSSRCDAHAGLVSTSSTRSARGGSRPACPGRPARPGNLRRRASLPWVEPLASPAHEEVHMKDVDRRSFLRIAGISLGVGALYRVAPALAAPGAGADTARRLARANGEAVRPFTFVQLSDTHVGSGPPVNPGGTAAFERAVEVVNRLRTPPELILFTGDLTHDSEEPGEPERRMRTFQRIADRLRVKDRRVVPGEHDAGLDGGARFREVFGPTSY